MAPDIASDADAAAVPETAEGQAFPPLVKLLLSATTLAVFIAGALAAGQPALAHATGTAKLLILAGLATLLLFNYWVIKSRIHVDAQEIRQTWIWPKRMAWADVAQAKLIYVPYLSWIIAPRLMVRGRSGMVMLFHAADTAVLETFSRYVLAPGLRKA